LRRWCHPQRTVFMERGGSKRSPRASGAQLCASVAQTARGCSQLWNSVDLRGRLEGTYAIATCNCVACWRNLAAESVSSLATRASSYPKRPRTSGAAQLPKAVVHHHNSGITAPLISSVAQIHPGNNRILRHSSSAATHRQQPAPDAVLPRATECLAKPSTWASRALRQSSSAATRRPQLICASTQFFPRVRHCHRRSRESDAQLPLPQLSVTARRVPRAEHVTPRPQRAQSSTASQRSLLSAPPRAALIKGGLDLAPSARAAAHVTGTRCCEATKLTRPDQCTSGRSRWKQGRSSLLP
jgi:hypothetical protein